MSPGRFDQYMYPFYKDSVVNGGIHNDQANELLDCLWVKFNEVCKLRDEGFAKGFGGYPMFQNLNVGGQAVDGSDATNALSYACLDATIRTRLPQPSVSIRVWKGSPETLMHKGAELARTGIGMPAWFSDDAIMASMQRRGVTQDDARNYCILGCVEPNVGGKTLGMHGAAFFNLVKVLEITLNNGMCDGIQVGPPTGNASKFGSIDEMLIAYQRQMAHFVKLMTTAINELDRAHAEGSPLPYQSSLICSCVARGISAQEGGAVYNMTATQGVGVANVADALMSIKHLVFEKKSLSMEKLMALLDCNFATGNRKDAMSSITSEKCAYVTESSSCAPVVRHDEGEYYKQMILNCVHKYGNDFEEVDELARAVALIYCQEVEKYNNARGGTFMTGLYPVSANVPMGKVCGATPDGRCAGEPLADGISPAPGRDKNGPTAVLNSASRLDHTFAGNGALLNQKFHPSAMEGEQGLANLSSLVRAYFSNKGSHLQFNVISRETLLDAKKNPENYRNLVVRVAGYSAHFVNLSSDIQDDIISRTDQKF
jgi:formate C-acetyltransferase